MKFALSTLAIAAVVGTAALAQEELPGHVKARQGQMYILAVNLGILGGMAKGEMEYNAEAATASAESIHAVSMIHQDPLWQDGTDEMSIDDSRAKAEIWDNFDDFKSKWSDLGTAAEELVQTAGTGQEALGGAMGKIGGACKACHDDYRAPEQ